MKSWSNYVQTREAVIANGAWHRDYEYTRCGTANVFMITEPKGGRHWARVTHRRTRKEFAESLQFIARKYPRAIRIHLVMDNLNTHTEESLTQTFGLRAGRRLWARFHIHYTPKHGSWLNQAELALSVMARMCLAKQRFASARLLRQHVAAFWAVQRRRRWTIRWQWTSNDAVQWLKQYMSKH